MKKLKIVTQEAPAAIGPYSQAIKIEGLVYTSGQIPLDSKSGVISGDGIEEQTRQVLKNLASVLEAAGSSFSDVIKTTVYIRSMDDFPVVNAIYGEFFTEPYPARSCVEVSGLPKNVLIEIEAVALADEIEKLDK